MLSRVATRSLQTPALRTAVASRIASSTVWSRSMARHNKPNQAQKKFNFTPRPPGVPPSTGPTGPGGPSVTSNSPLGAKSSDKSGRPEFSSKQVEANKNAAPASNTIPESAGKAVGNTNTTTRKGESPEVLGNQEESNENTAPKTSSSPPINPAEPEAEVPLEPLQPLPDLTKGIPSTWAYETSGAIHKSPLNLTEAEEPAEGSGGGRARGELPASAYVSSSERKRLRFANYMYALFAASAVAGTVYLGRNWESEEEEKENPDAPSGWAIGLMWNRAKARMEGQLNYYNKPAFKKLLPDPDPIFKTSPYTLVLSMEDLLIHSEWSREHGWRMAKRPGVDYFIRYLSQYYELVIFTTQPSQLAEPVIRKLDPFRIATWPLFREATLYENGEYIKDLSYLNRDLSKVIMIDTKASHAKNQPENAIILKPWEGDPQDKELVALIPFLEYIYVMQYPDVRETLKAFEGKHIPTEFAKREAIARKKFQEQVAAEQKKRPKHSGVGLLGNALGIKHQNMMVDPHEQSPAEAFAQGKMLQDQARERGQRVYEALEKEIRENGPKWLAEEAAAEKKAAEEATKAMKSGFTGYFSGSK